MKNLHLLYPLQCWLREPYSSSICSLPEVEGGGGGGGGEPPKTFTQEQLNSLLKKERESTAAATAAKFSDYEDLKGKVVKLTELEAKVTELTEAAELAGKTAAEKAALQSQKALDKAAQERASIEKERDSSKAAYESEKSAHNMTRVRTTMSQALATANVLPAASEDALDRLIESSTDIKFDDKGRLVALTLKSDGTEYTDFRKAAEAFLKEKPFFQKAPAGGTGTNRPGGNNGTGGNNKPLHEMSESELLALDSQSRQQK